MAKEILDLLIQQSQYISSKFFDRFPIINSDLVPAGSSDLTWGLVTTNQTVGGLAQNLTV